MGTKYSVGETVITNQIYIALCLKGKNVSRTVEKPYLTERDRLTKKTA